MGLGFGLSLRHTVKVEQKQQLPFDTAGELELFSLHRIKHRMPSMHVHKSVREQLIAQLTTLNEEYRKEKGHERYCITPDHVDVGVDNVKAALQEQADAAIAPYSGSVQGLLREQLYQGVDTETAVVQRWFADNYDSLIYDVNANIPYVVVLRMRASFRKWAYEQVNPFQESLESMVEELLVKRGRRLEDFESPEKAWNYLKRFRPPVGNTARVTPEEP